MLNRAGYRCQEANNGFEALKAVRKVRYDAVLIDVVMPLMDGFEFLERLRKIPGCEAIPAIFVTGRSTESERERASSLGASDYYVKPISEHVLIQRLDVLCVPKSTSSNTNGRSSPHPE